MSTPNRAAQTERAYRNHMRERLIDLLKVMNQQDVLQFQGLKYEELVAYARDWLQTEVIEVTATKEEPKAIPVQVGLSLD